MTAAARSGRDSRWKEFLNSTRCTGCTSFPNPVVWITEVGGVVSFMASGQPRKTYGVEIAGRQIDYILSLARTSRG